MGTLDSRDSQISTNDPIARRAQLIGTMSSYSVYQLSEGTEHKQFVECESECMDLLLVDPNGELINNGGNDGGGTGSKVSFMTGPSRGLINDDNEEEFNFEDGKSYESPSPHDHSGSNPSPFKPKYVLVKK